MARKLMIDPPSGWRHGFPIYVNESEGINVQEMDLEQLREYLYENGYPKMMCEENAGWTRFMWIDDEY